MGFQELLREVSPKLKSIACKISRQSQGFGSDDLFQEAALHLWVSFNDGRLAEKTQSYILQGCYFYLKNYVRKNTSRARFLSIESSYPGGDEAPPGAMELEDRAAARFIDELHDRMLADAIRSNGLTRREKEIINLYGEGLTVREIGCRMGISHVGVIKITRKIRQKCLFHLDEN